MEFEWSDRKKLGNIFGAAVAALSSTEADVERAAADDLDASMTTAGDWEDGESSGRRLRNQSR